MEILEAVGSAKAERATHATHASSIFAQLSLDVHAGSTWADAANARSGLRKILNVAKSRGTRVESWQVRANTRVEIGIGAWLSRQPAVVHRGAVYI